MRQQLNDWMRQTKDQGLQPESAELYDSDMAVYTRNLQRKANSEHLNRIRDNIALMKKWASEGK